MRESHISEIDSNRKWCCYRSFSAFAFRKFTCCALTIQYIICSTVGRSIANIYNRGKYASRGGIYRLYLHLPTVLNILHSTVSAQQTNLLPEDTSRNDTISPKSLYRIYKTTSQCLSSYGCTIIVLYIVLYDTFLHYSNEFTSLHTHAHTHTHTIPLLISFLIIL